jgi:hypothetical protein
MAWTHNVIGTEINSPDAIRILVDYSDDNGNVVHDSCTATSSSQDLNWLKAQIVNKLAELSALSTFSAAIPTGTIDLTLPPPSTPAAPTVPTVQVQQQMDTDGAPLSRIKVAPTGWSFNYRMIEIQLSTVGGISNLDVNGNDVGDASIKLYDANNTLITDPAQQGNAVKTVVDLEPPYNICVAGGCLRMDTKPASDVTLNVIAVPDVPAQYGGSKVFIQNVNLTYIYGTIGLNADGRAAKQLNYDVVHHTNKFRFIFKHDAGYQFWCAILMEIYKQ